MPDIKQLLSEEIRRLAKKEAKAAAEPLRSQITALKKIILEQNRKIKKLTDHLPAEAVPEAAEEAKPKSKRHSKSAFRLTPQRIIKIRQKRGLTQAQLAKLMDVNQFSISHWELGKNKPRESQKVLLVQIRDMGKREFKALLARKLNPVKTDKTEKKEAAAPVPAAK